MILNNNNLKKINAQQVILPDEQLITLPEKVLQFGTGVLLRGLPDYFIDKANRQGIFNGRIVVVKSTGTGSAADFDEQDSLYTLNIKGIKNGKDVDQSVVCAAISRVLSANSQWDDILKVACDPMLNVVISNTTEAGITFSADNINDVPPASFPGKLLAVLYERFKAFGNDHNAGLIIIPTELIVDNGKKLKEIVLQLAAQNSLEQTFIDWLNNSNYFCSSLVDRIVPGKPESAVNDSLNREAGYEDNLRIVAEPYSLWAIEGDEQVASQLSFTQADDGVLVSPDIEKFRELKLRLLNATHTLSCAVAVLADFVTVREAMRNAGFEKFISRLMIEEIAPAIPYAVSKAEREDFARKVLDRFRNPHIEHRWLSISLQYTSKIKMRVLPLLHKHYELSNQPPQLMALGFAAYLRFMRINLTGDKFAGNINGNEYIVADEFAASLAEKNQAGDNQSVVKKVLSDSSLWGTDLTQLPGFEASVNHYLGIIDSGGINNILNEL